MNFDARTTKINTSRTVLAEVLKLGESAGLFTVVNVRSGDADTPDTRENVQHATVETPEGLSFSLHAGSWNREGKISASVAYLDRDGLKSGPRDVLRYGVAAPEAQCSHERGAAVVLRELSRRIIQNPEAVKVAQEVRDRWQTLARQRDGLGAQVEHMEKIGYYLPEHHKDKSKTYNATLYRSFAGEHAPGSVEITSEGIVSADIRCTVEKFAAILEILNK